MKMLKVNAFDGEEIYVNPNHIIFLRKRSDNGTRIVIESLNVINSIDPLAVVLSDLERLNYD